MLRGFMFPLSLLFTMIAAAKGAPLTVAASDWTVIGTVGQWQFTGEKDSVRNPVVIGTPLRNGYILYRATPSKTGSITLFDGVGHRTIACDDPSSLPDQSKEGCIGPIVVKVDPTSNETKMDGPITTLLSAVRDLITAQPTTYYKTVSRDYAGLDDNVLTEQSGSVNLTPLLSTLSKGSYTLNFVPAHGANASKNVVAATNVVWDPEANGHSSQVKLSSGLYVVFATAASGTSAGEAWILVASGSQAQTKADAFGTIKALTDSWREDSPAASIKAMNRAALDSLSRQP